MESDECVHGHLYTVIFEMNGVDTVVHTMLNMCHIEMSKPNSFTEFCTMEPYDDAMSHACDGLWSQIQRSSKTKDTDLPPLDILLREHIYDFGDISDWPNDICPISPSKMLPLEQPEVYFLGSLAACVHLPTHQANVTFSCERVSIVLSFCAREMNKIRGQPLCGWKTWFEELHIQWFTFELQDPKTRLTASNGFCEEMANAWMSCWMDMCIMLLSHLMHQPLRDERGILFHCFGGINRSSAALCAWLIFRHDLTAEEAVHSLLVARPSLYPWKFRPHALWALKTWEKTRANVI